MVTDDVGERVMLMLPLVGDVREVVVVAHVMLRVQMEGDM